MSDTHQTAEHVPSWAELVELTRQAVEESKKTLAALREARALLTGEIL